MPYILLISFLTLCLLNVEKNEASVTEVVNRFVNHGVVFDLENGEVKSKDLQ